MIVNAYNDICIFMLIFLYNGKICDNVFNYTGDAILDYPGRMV